MISTPGIELVPPITRSIGDGPLLCLFNSSGHNRVICPLHAGGRLRVLLAWSDGSTPDSSVIDEGRPGTCPALAPFAAVVSVKE